MATTVYQPLIKAIDAYLQKADDDLAEMFEDEGRAEPKDSVKTIGSIEDKVEDSLSKETNRIISAIKKHKTLAALLTAGVLDEIFSDNTCRNVNKAREIKNAKISFVSLVDKAANKREFLITMAQDGKADWEAVGRIIKADGNTHHVTGVVYEPMTEDTQGDFMSAESIEKTAHDFLKNCEGCDLQHDFKLQKGVSVVESWIAKADFEIDGEKVTKGTWLMTAEISDKSLWDKIQKGDFFFSVSEQGNVVVEYDINSLVTYTGKDKSYRKNKVIRVFAEVAEMIKANFPPNRYTNDPTGWAVMEGVGKTILKRMGPTFDGGSGALKNIDYDNDFTVDREKSTGDETYFNVGTQPVDAAEKLYFTVKTR